MDRFKIFQQSTYEATTQTTYGENVTDETEIESKLLRKVEPLVGAVIVLKLKV